MDLHEARLAATTLAYYGNGFTISQVKAHVIDSADVARPPKAPAAQFKPDAQVLDGEQNVSLGLSFDTEVSFNFSVHAALRGYNRANI